MQTLLIVEDEKLIRQGIATMAQRSGVPIDKILQCKNGVEALEIIDQQAVDAVLTDIRMPKMDGIELVDQLSKRNNVPQMAVISGFDDFNYAVEMMKRGTVDYILKPVKREKIEEVLQKMEDNLQAASKQENSNKNLLEHHLKKIFLGAGISSKEADLLEQSFARYFGDEAYCLLITNEFAESVVHNRQYFLLKEIDNQQALLCKSRQIPQVISQLTRGNSVGISLAFDSVYNGDRAYQQALAARKEAFVAGRQYLQYEQKMEPKGQIRDHFAEQFVQKFPTDRYDKAMADLQNLYFQARHNEISAETILACMDDLQERLKKSYPQVIEETLVPLTFGNMEEYIEKEKYWMNQMRSSLKEQFDMDRNQEKIHQAVRYIKENYCSDLNMAMVSNHVSMNYSLFSVVFKEYTGVNFVNYLKIIRIDEAKRLLAETDDKIFDISRKVGYENEKHFMKTFKTVCGVSPSEYRKNAGIV